MKSFILNYCCEYEFLLKHCADPNALSDYVETPLHLTLRTMLFGTKYQDDWTDSYLRAENLWDFLGFEQNDIDAVFAEISLKREGVLDAPIMASKPIRSVQAALAEGYEQLAKT